MTNSIQKKNVVSEYYDTTDPFIDDSELAVDERQFFAQTKQQGFYVSSGEVALLKDKYVSKMIYTFLFFLSILAYIGRVITYRTPKKPKSKKLSFVPGLQKTLQTEKKHLQLVEGTRDTPIAIDSDDKRLNMEDPSASLSDEHAGQKRKRQNSTSESGKRKKIIDEVCSLTFFKRLSFVLILYRQCFIRSCRSLSRTSKNG